MWREHERTFAGRVARGAGRVVARAAMVNGTRKSMGWLFDEFFLGVRDEIDEQEVSNRVAADMLGVSRRTYMRRVEAAEAGIHGLGSSLWWSVLREFDDGPRSKESLLTTFSRHTPEMIGAILRDMREAGLLEQCSDGTLALATFDEEWTERRTRDFVVLMALSTDASVSELASKVGKSEEEVREILRDSDLHEHFVEPQDEVFWALLSVIATHLLAVLHKELGGESTATHTFQLIVTDRQRDKLPVIQRELERAKQRLRATYADLLEEHGTDLDVTGETVFTSIVSELITDSDWP